MNTCKFQRLRRASILGAAALCLSALASCGTAISLVNRDETKVFGGVIILTTKMIPDTNHNMWVGWICIPDLPVSLAADIILLPLTITLEVMRASEKTSEKRNEESREPRPSEDQLLMEIRYPVGSSRAAIVRRHGAPERVLDLAGKDPEPYITRALRELKLDGRRSPVRCEEYSVLRRTLGSSLGAFGMYMDYVFYDAQGVVLGAKRRFLD